MYNLALNIISSVGSSYTTQYHKVSRTPLSFREECAETARYISSVANKPITIAFSGGIDSEVVCRAFIDANIPFTAITFRYMVDGDLRNGHDIIHAENFCKEFNINQTLIDVDIKDFIQNKVPQYIAKDYKSHNLGRYMFLHILETIEELGGCAVLGTGEQLYKTVNDEICLSFGTGYFMNFEQTKNTQAIHFPYFFITTPEITSSYILSPLIDFLITSGRYHKNTDQPGYIGSFEKPLVLYSEYPGMVLRPKYTGYESLYKFAFPESQRLQSLFVEYKEIPVPIAEVKRQLGI